LAILRIADFSPGSRPLFSIHPDTLSQGLIVDAGPDGNPTRMAGRRVVDSKAVEAL
jgi:hypothetical protein